MALNPNISTGTREVGKAARGTKGLGAFMNKASATEMTEEVKREESIEKKQAVVKETKKAQKPSKTESVNADNATEALKEQESKTTEKAEKEESREEKTETGLTTSMIYIPKQICDYLISRSAYEGLGISDMVNELIHQEHGRVKGKRLSDLLVDENVVKHAKTSGERVSKSIRFDEESFKFIEQVRKQYAMKRSAYVVYIIAKEQLSNPDFRTNEIIE